MATEINRDEHVAHKLKWAIESGRKEQAKITKAFSGSFMDSEYSLRWMSGTYKAIFYAALCENAQTDGLVKVMTWTKMMLQSWSPENSTSPYSNACNNEKFEAYRDFIRDFSHYVGEEA